MKNLLAPVYGIIELLAELGIFDLTKYLELEKLLHSIDLGIAPAGVKYDFRIPVINWIDLASQGAQTVKQVATSRSNPANAAGATTWANSFKEELSADQYAGYAASIDITDAKYFKNTQTHIVADKGDTLMWVLTWALDMFATAENQEALVQFLINFFELQSGAEQTVRYAISQLFAQANAFGASDMIVSALVSALGVGITLEATLMGDIATLQQIYKDLFGAIGNGSGNAYGKIADVLEDLTGVWKETVGTEEEKGEAEKEAGETLNSFQKLIKKIKEFFAKIFSIFK